MNLDYTAIGQRIRRLRKEESINDLGCGTEKIEEELKKEINNMLKR